MTFFVSSKRRDRAQSASASASQPETSATSECQQSDYDDQSSTNDQMTGVPRVQLSQVPYISTGQAVSYRQKYRKLAVTSKNHLQEQKEHTKHLVRKSYGNLRDALQETVSVTHQAVDEVQGLGTSVGRSVVQLRDTIEKKFDDIVTAIDESRFSGREEDLGKTLDSHDIRSISTDYTIEVTYVEPSIRGGDGRETAKSKHDEAISKSTSSTNYFSKVYHYANSRLPPHLPPLKLYVFLSGN